MYNHHYLNIKFVSYLSTYSSSSSIPQNQNPNPNLPILLRSFFAGILRGSEDGVSTARYEHIACSSADEQCDHNRREGPQRMPQRDHSRSLAIRCAIQARPRHADQYQEDRQS